MKRCFFAMIVFLLAVGSLPAAAQGVPQVQEFTGEVTDNADIVFYDLVGLQAGHTLYVYVEATAGNLDTYLFLGDIDFDTVLHQDDDSGGGYNSAMQYTLPESGDYAIAVTRYDASSSGSFRLLIGLDAPDVLTGAAAPTGHEIATLYGAVTSDGSLTNNELGYTDCSILEVRPTLSGPELIRETDYFLLHYTHAGRDGATESYVDEVERILDAVWKREVDEFGWPPPPADCGEGGDTRYDVYLMETINTEQALGYTMPEGLIGDNPHTAPVEAWAVYSYLVVDNDFAGYGPEGLSLMRTTASHEFHHSIQFGFDLNDIDGYWYYEATATWMETQVFPEDEDASPYVGDLFATPDLCIGSTPDDARYDARIYAEWTLIDSLVRDHGQDALRRLWDLIAFHEGLDSFYLLLDELDTTPQEVMQRYAIRNLLLDYTLGPEFGARVHVESNINGFGEVVPREDGVEQLGVDYLLVTTPARYTFTVEPSTLALTAVGVDQAAGVADIYDLGAGGTVDATQYDYTYLIVLNTQEHTNTSTCTMTAWTITASDGAANPLETPEPKQWGAANFIPAG